MAGLDGVTAPIDTDADIAYGASATPTFVLIDRKGLVRLYTPTRLSEEELVAENRSAARGAGVAGW